MARAMEGYCCNGLPGANLARSFSRSSSGAGRTVSARAISRRCSNPHPVLGSTEVFKTFNYAPAVAAGGLLFVAGQIGIRADGTVPESVEEQIDLAFQRLGAILAEAGLDFGDLVELVTYHVDVDKQLVAFRGIKDRYIKENPPAWTILGVAALARPTLLIEIKAVAATRSV